VPEHEDRDRRGQRAIELELEVPGTPEQVWEAIATGPGISAWLQPTEVEPREGGRFSFRTGPVRREGTVTGWEPPSRFVQEVSWDPTGEAPARRLATEWTVRATGRGTCRVRMVMTGFGPGADWDDELEGMAAGMAAGLDALRLHLTWFPGGRPSWARASVAATGPVAELWGELAGALEIDPGIATGDRVEVDVPSGPSFSGVVERAAGNDGGRDLLVRVERPAPGFIGVFVLGGVWAGIEAALYGDEAPAVAARVEPVWRAWLQARFPAAADATGSATAPAADR
jgi:uncharacterized protein YndB with AHSA1/START domain